MNVVSAEVAIIFPVAIEWVNWTCQKCLSEFPFHDLENIDLILTMDGKKWYVKSCA